MRDECRSIKRSSAECPHEVFNQLFTGVEIPVDAILDYLSRELGRPDQADLARTWPSDLART